MASTGFVAYTKVRLALHESSQQSRNPSFLYITISVPSLCIVYFQENPAEDRLVTDLAWGAHPGST
jgi:hypothetical protein